MLLFSTSRHSHTSSLSRRCRHVFVVAASSSRHRRSRHVVVTSPSPEEHEIDEDELPYLRFGFAAQILGDSTWLRSTFCMRVTLYISLVQHSTIHPLDSISIDFHPSKPSISLEMVPIFEGFFVFISNVISDVS